MTKFTTFASALLLTTALAACGDKAETAETAPMDNAEMNMPEADKTADPIKITAEPVMMTKTYPIQNAGGYDLGEVTIKDVADGVEVMVSVNSLPEGTSAIHFHETGTCDGPDFTSAGGHYNPDNVSHGKNTGSGPHAGDMDNFDVPVSGMVTFTRMNKMVSLSERDGFAPLLDDNGTALIIHAEADDYESQPSGAAGARIACAVID